MNFEIWTNRSLENTTLDFESQFETYTLTYNNRTSASLTALMSACIWRSSSTWLIFSCCSSSISRLYCARQRPSWSPLRTSLTMDRFSRSSVIVLFLHTQRKQTTVTASHKLTTAWLEELRDVKWLLIESTGARRLSLPGAMVRALTGSPSWLLTCGIFRARFQQSFLT